MHFDWSWVVSAATAAVVASIFRSGSSAKRTSARLEALEQEVRALREHLGIVPPATMMPPAVMTSAMPEGSMPEVEAFIRQGKKIEAIRVYRQITRQSLKDSKYAVEAMERQMKYRA